MSAATFDESRAMPAGLAGTFMWLVAALVVVFGVGLALMVTWSDREEERVQHDAQVRLTMQADAQLRTVHDWLDRQYNVLEGLAQNAALQLYMTQIQASQAGGAETNAQAAFLHNLIVATARHGGFYASNEGADPAIRANVRRTGISGIALLSPDGRVMTATAEMPPLEGALKSFWESLTPAEQALTGPYAAADGAPVIALAEPVYAVQGGNQPSDLVGWIIGVRPVESLYERLTFPGDEESSAETILVQESSGGVSYLSPMKHHPASPLTFELDKPADKLAARKAVADPGSFAVLPDYRFEPVLMVSRWVGGAPWVLMRKVDESEVMAGVRGREKWAMVAYLLAAGAAAILLVAFWYYAGAHIARRHAALYRRMSENYHSQEALLKLVTDSQPNPMFIVDEEGRYRFANTAAAKPYGVPAVDLSGKSLAAVMGPETARRYAEAIVEAREAGETLYRVYRDEMPDGQTHTLQVEYVPLLQEDGEESSSSVLVVEEDITAAMSARERREEVLRRVVDNLLAAIDRKDPHAVDHSLKVAQVARKIAVSMRLDSLQQETAEMAGKLMNLGKALVAPQLLTKPEALSDEEKALLHDALRKSVEVAKDIPFDGPLAETLEQAQECPDGSGPLGLKKKDILKTAAIIAVANGYVGMTSPRAWREALSSDEAVKELLSGVDERYDRAAVVTLASLVEGGEFTEA